MAAFWVDDVPLLMTDFGVNGTVAGKSVRGIFDAAYDVSSAGLNGIASTAPVFIVPSAAVPAAAYGSQVVIPEGAFTVLEARHDGTGVCNLVLERAA